MHARPESLAFARTPGKKMDLSASPTTRGQEAEGTETSNAGVAFWDGTNRC